MRGNEGSHPNCETLSGEGVRRERDTVWIPTHLPLFISYLRGSLFIGGLYFFTDTMELHNAVKSSKKTRMKKEETRKKKKKMKKINKNKEIDLLIVFANFFSNASKILFLSLLKHEKKKLSNSFTFSNAYSSKIYFFPVWNTKKPLLITLFMIVRWQTSSNNLKHFQTRSYGKFLSFPFFFKHKKHH